jgi:hypothetical protein
MDTVRACLDCSGSSIKSWFFEVPEEDQGHILDPVMV